MADTPHTNGSTSNSPPNTNSDFTEQQLKRLEELVGNASMMRMEILRQLINPGRNVDQEYSNGGTN